MSLKMIEIDAEGAERDAEIKREAYNAAIKTAVHRFEDLTLSEWRREEIIAELETMLQ